VRDACGADFDALWQKLHIGDCPAWLCESQEQVDASNLTDAFFAFLNASSIDDLRLVLSEHAALLDDSIAALFAAVAQQYKEDEHAAALISARHDLWQACRAQGVEATFEMLSKMQRLNEALQRYIELRQAAKEDDVVAWKAAVEAGEAIFVAEFEDSPGVDWDTLSEDLAGAYTNLCIAHEKASDFNASLAATERAIALQPNNAMWQRNRASTLIDLGRLDEAAQAIAVARAMEPGAPRLKELEDQLAQARASKQGESAHE
jgi:tetratricopeptide (TPR) repeat protein